MPPEPAIHLEIDPRSVHRCFTRRSALDKLLFFGNRALLPPQIRRGNWDRRTYPFRDHKTYRLMRALVDHPVDADAIRRSIASTSPGHQGKPGPAVESQDLEAYLQPYRALLQSLRHNGYVRDAGYDDMGVAVARDGSLVKVSLGNHRFALAQILELESVPVEVRFVHRRWFRHHGGRVSSDLTAQIRHFLQADGRRVIKLPASQRASRKTSPRRP